MQRWDFGESETENGIYLGQLAAVSLKGPCKYANVRVSSHLEHFASRMALNLAEPLHFCLQKKLPFDYTKLNLRLGPKWFDFDIKIPNKWVWGSSRLIIQQNCPLKTHFDST